MKELKPLKTVAVGNCFVTIWTISTFQVLRLLFRKRLYVVEREFISEKTISTLPVLEAANKDPITNPEAA